MKAADALDRVLKGEAVEASKPVHELAELAALLQGAWQDGPTPASSGRGRAAALAAFQETAAAATVPSIVPFRPGGRRSLVARVALVAALVAGLPTAAWGASEDSLPGEVLYPVKRGFEEVRLVLAGDAASEAEVLLGMTEERLEEAVLAMGRGLDGVVDQALAGYDEALLRFRVRIAQAQAQGLPVAALLEEARDLAIIQEELFEDDVVPAIVPPGPPADPAEASEGGKGENGKGVKGGKAQGKGGGKGEKGNRGNAKGSGGGGGGGGSAGGSSGGSGGGGGSGAGGAGAGGGVGDGREEDPPEPPDDDGDEGEGEGSGSGHGSAEGEGVGHEIGKGKGHDKHDEDG